MITSHWRRVSRILPLALCLLAFTDATRARAEVVWSDNVAVLAAAPSELAVEDTQGSLILVFNEQQGVTLETALRLDNGTVIPAGVVVNSHLIVYDPLAGRFAEWDFAAASWGPLPLYEDGVEQTGSVAFDGEILGVAFTHWQLRASEFLGAPETRYADADDPELRTPWGCCFFRGAETFSRYRWARNDSYHVTSSEGGLFDSISVTLREGRGGHYQGDWLRVVTRAPQAECEADPFQDDIFCGRGCEVAFILPLLTPLRRLRRRES